MKKFISGFLVGLLLAFILINAVAEGNLRLIVNGKDITAVAVPILQNNKVYTPARSVAEALGATVEWNSETRTVSIDKSMKADEGDDNKVEGYLTFSEIRSEYNLGWLGVDDHRGLHIGNAPFGNPSNIVPSEVTLEARNKGGEVIFVAGPEPGHVAFSIPWQENWDYFKFDEILIDESEFLEAYNAYLASKEE